jgi:hypothetical protein
MKQARLILFWGLSVSVTAGIVGLFGCATIVSGKSQELSFTSEPEEATVTAGGRVLGKTPLTLQLEKKSGQILTFEKEGYKPQTMQLSMRMDGLFLGNILLGGLIGTTIDGITGAVHEYSPSQYYVTLVPESSGPMGPIGDKAEAKVFIVAGYKSIIEELHSGKAEYLSSLFTLLKIPEGKQDEAIDKIRSLSELYPSIPEFAERVASYYLK